MRRLVLDGFFPFVDRGARPQQRRATGLQELGLPYAHDAGVTRHLADFLARHGRQPTAVLFNGGVMKGELLRSAGDRDGGRLAGARPAWRRWPAPTSTWRWPAARPTTAWCAAGAASASAAAPAAPTTSASRRRCRPSPASPPPVKALCVVPFGMEEGTALKLPDEELGLVVGETAEFRFFAASNRKTDSAGRAARSRGRRASRSWARSRPRLPAGQGAAAGRHRAGVAGDAADRGGHARAVVRGARGRRPLEAGVLGARSGVTGAVGRARFIIGIDLGTTNTAVAFVDTRSSVLRVRTFEVPQLVAPGGGRPAAAAPLLRVPGRRARPGAGRDRACPGRIRPAPRVVVGELARSQGVLQPSRMIASAKSWLCHPGVDRHAAILPWGVEDGPRCRRSTPRRGCWPT